MLYPIVVIVYTIFLAGQYALNGLSSSGPDGTIFLNKTGDLSDFYKTAITPAGWTFSIWGFIYAWQAAWLVYSLVNICRKVANGPAYANPMFLPPLLFIICILICCLNITWLITFDRQEIEVACASLIAYSLMMYAALIVSYRALEKSSPALVEQKRTYEIWLTRGLVHNGLGIQATWVSIATLLNIAMVMTYSGDKVVSMDTAATIVLSVLAAGIVVFALTDFVFLDRYSRYTITPYIVLVVALIGSLSKNYEEGARNSIFTIVLLAVAGFLLLQKIIITIYRHIKCQRYTTLYEATIGENKPSGQLA